MAHQLSIVAALALVVLSSTTNAIILPHTLDGLKKQLRSHEEKMINNNQIQLLKKIISQQLLLSQKKNTLHSQRLNITPLFSEMVGGQSDFRWDKTDVEPEDVDDVVDDVVVTDITDPTTISANTKGWKPVISRANVSPDIYVYDEKLQKINNLIKGLLEEEEEEEQIVVKPAVFRGTKPKIRQTGTSSSNFATSHWNGKLVLVEEEEEEEGGQRNLAKASSLFSTSLFDESEWHDEQQIAITAPSNNPIYRLRQNTRMVPIFGPDVQEEVGEAEDVKYISQWHTKAVRAPFTNDAKKHVFHNIADFEEEEEEYDDEQVVTTANYIHKKGTKPTFSRIGMSKSSYGIARSQFA